MTGRRLRTAPFYIYATAAVLVFPKLFFPTRDPFIAVALWEAGDGSPWLVGVYLSSMALLTLVALLLGKETKDVGLDEGEAPDATGRDEAPAATTAP